MLDSASIDYTSDAEVSRWCVVKGAATAVLRREEAENVPSAHLEVIFDSVAASVNGCQRPVKENLVCSCCMAAQAFEGTTRAI